MELQWKDRILSDTEPRIKGLIISLGPQDIENFVRPLLMFET